MQEEINLKISQFLDEEVGLHEGLSLLQHLQEHSESAATLQRYAAVSGAIKSGAAIAADAGFVDQVSRMLADEPTVFAPAALRPRKPNFKLATAIAASLAAVATIVGGTLYLRDAQLASGALQTARHDAAASAYAQAVQSQANYQDRFNEYLEAHGATLYTGGYAPGRAYGQVASYGRR